MVNQSDIPSQQSNPPRRAISDVWAGADLVPPVLNISPGAPMSPGYTVSTYDARPPNSFDVVLAPQNMVAVTGARDGVRIDYNSPNGYACVLNKIAVGTTLIHELQSPYPVPVAAANAFLTTVTGRPLAVGGARIFMDIEINNTISIYRRVRMNDASADYTFPLYLPVEQNSPIAVFIYLQTVPPGADYDPIITNAEITLTATLIPATGLTADEQVLNHG